ncbi:MAG: uroporphyrinogen decarboxylase family protein [Promethearchaeia archaeon]
MEKKENLKKYYEKYGDNKSQWFLDSVSYPIIEKVFNPVIHLLTKDRYINVIAKYAQTSFHRVSKYVLDLLCAKIEKKLGVTDELRKCMFGFKGMKEKRSALAYLLDPILREYIKGWKERKRREEASEKIIREKEKIPKIWMGWKKLRDKVCPNFNLNFDPEKDQTIKILPDDMLLPKERINRLMEFKDVDRIAFGPTLTHAVSLMGAQPRYDIGGFWQYAYGPGNKMAKATVNTWIRVGGLDWFPSVMTPLANPIPETHSPFYYEWKPPTDTNYEQFIEKELFKLYDQISDWGLSSLAQKVSKWVLYWAMIGIKETLKAYLGVAKYFPSEFMDCFELYAGSIFALWDIIPMARGMIPFMKDLRKRPEEIIRVFKFLEPGLTELGLAIAKIANAKYVLIGNSRGSSSWISPQMFEDIFWPSQKATCEKIIKEGFKLCAHLDNDWTENMEYMLELPKHSGFFHLDQANLPKVREIIGDHFCLMGNLQPAITTGSGPEAVYKKTKELIQTCGKEGGYIVATGCEAPAAIPIEDYYAMKRAIKDYGVFKK